jgi:chemotaxis protein histidine kinase CheA
VGPAALAEFFFRLIDSVRALIDQANGRPPAPGAVIADVAAEIAGLIGRTLIEQPRAGIGLPAAPAKVDQELLAQLREKVSGAEQSEEVLQLIDALDQQTREYSQIGLGLQEQLDKLRTVPLQSMLRRLLRPVRDAARQEGKLVELQLQGGDIRVEREIVERLHAPLLHITRNAVSHGIEPPPTRQAAAKPPTGNLRVHAHRHNGHLVITVTDDGAGLDYETIYAKAEAHGWVDPGQLPPRHELARFILRPGFSTKEEVTDLAGRGVGMDVVAREIDALNGHIDIESLDGRGTSIRLTVPLPSV